jgi:hypothetical protein
MPASADTVANSPAASRGNSNVLVIDDDDEHMPAASFFGVSPAVPSPGGGVRRSITHFFDLRSGKAVGTPTPTTALAFCPRFSACVRFHPPAVDLSFLFSPLLLSVDADASGSWMAQTMEAAEVRIGRECGWWEAAARALLLRPALIRDPRRGIFSFFNVSLCCCRGIVNEQLRVQIC